MKGKSVRRKINYHGYSPWYSQATPAASLISCASSTPTLRRSGLRTSKIRLPQVKLSSFRLTQIKLLHWGFFTRSTKSDSSWQKYQSKTKVSRWRNKLLVVAGCLLLLVMVIFVWKGVRFIISPLKQAIGATMAAPVWDRKAKINLLFFEIAQDFQESPRVQTIFLASLEPEKGTLIFLNILPETLIITSKGAYPASKLYALGATLNPPRQTDFLVNSFKNYFALPIDGYVAQSAKLKIKNEKLKIEENIVEIHSGLQGIKFFFRIPAIVRFIKSEVYTNLSPRQVFKLLWQGRGVRFDKLAVVELNEDILDLRRLETGEKVKVADKVQLDKEVKNLFSEERITYERLKIQFLNGTEIAGLGTMAARFIENLGGEVLEVGNAESSDFKKTKIVNYAGKDSRTVQRLEQIFGVKSEKVKSEQPQRADVVIIVGEDWAGK